MNKFRKLDLPKHHTIHTDSPYSRIKWCCSVEGSATSYLHNDLHIYDCVTAEGQKHTGIFDSEEEALRAYKNYYYMYAKEPGH